MSDSQRVYAILQRLHVNQWDDRLQDVVSGWQIKAQWASTGTVLEVFVPDSHYTADNVDTAIRQAGELDEQVHALGA